MCMDPTQHMTSICDYICWRDLASHKAILKKINQLLDNILKTILMVPQSTPREALYLEVGILDPIQWIDLNRMMLYNINSLYRDQNCLNSALIQENLETKWKTETEKSMNEYHVDENEILKRQLPK